MRTAEIERNTAETQIAMSIELDGIGSFAGSTGIGFFDHMLDLLACHSGMDISIHVHGDLEVDTHHTIEDLGIVLGQALYKALGDKAGITRYGMFYCPMDETLTRCVIDLSGRSYLVYDVAIPAERIGTFETEMLREFLYAVAVHGRMNLHVTTLYGTNAHHIVESVFKALGHALKQAVYIEGENSNILSTKGVL
ncbi:MAG: imidazoleglycerol-phosphate dehydratase HisB [Megasphaera sp.]|jgi:imidazoleglycerol-phosphate dehydratase|uniref:imidazoleglycerol-phosphate dehydratase HisB n=1 Tax=Megasphaera sueciensis TaxID=349094 RepID=UPI003D094167|nr:imidazoleglycerol-phosphate dehydratase HisB [Megasphaera sp.]MCI1823656.1 imidazoleglycerol-phosphate dehydratase HisB [Megasphaera sp.]